MVRVLSPTRMHRPGRGQPTAVPSTTLRHRLQPAVLVLVVALVGIAPDTVVHAASTRCQQALVSKFGKFTQMRVKLLASCNTRVLLGRMPGPCPDTVTAAKIERFALKLRTAIAGKCGGADRTCGTGDDESLSAIGWDVGTCPGFGGAACMAAIANCDDVATCLLCVAEHATDQAMALAYEGRTPSDRGTELNRCQTTIGGGLTRFLATKLLALATCEQKVLGGRIPGPCPDAGRTVPKIVKAAAKIPLRICRACGGFDLACGGIGDQSPSQIGFPPSCPAVTVPEGPSCGTPVADLEDLAVCAQCMADFTADCLDALAVPQLKAYPSECQAAIGPSATPTATATRTPTPTRTPTVTLPLPTVTLPLPTLTVTLPLPSDTPTIPLPLDTPTVTLPLPTVTLPLPTLTVTLAVPTTTLTLPLATATLPIPTPTLPL